MCVSIARKSAGSVSRARSASVPASSTPVGPAPMTAKVSRDARRDGSSPAQPSRTPEEYGYEGMSRPRQS